MAELGTLHDSVCFIQNALDNGADLDAAKDELVAALAKWPTAPQLLDAATHFDLSDVTA